MKRGKDLGTYFVKWTLYDGRGVITEYHTGYGFTLGRGNSHPIEAFSIPPTWESEESLIETILFQFKHNNWSCDCNRELDLAHAYQQPEPEDEPGKENVCKGGPRLRIKRFEILNPRLEVVYAEEPFEFEFSLEETE